MQNYNLVQGSVQWGFYRSRAKLQMFGGGFGNGKTTALCIKFLGIVRDYPGCNLLLARATYPKLLDTLQKVFMMWAPPGAIKRRPTKDDNTVYFHNGSVVNFRYVAQRGKKTEDGNTTSNLLSATYDAIGIDQVEDPEIVHKDFYDLLGRLRGATPYRPPDGAEEDHTMPISGPRWLVLTCNPTHNWVFKELVQPWLVWQNRGVITEKLIVDEESGLPLMELYEGPTHINAANLPPDYIKTQEAAYKGQMRERYLLGKWAAYEGLVYPDFSDEKNILTRGQIIEYLVNCLKRNVKLQVIEGYDFGLSSPTCYLFGFIDDLGRVFLMDGFYIPDFVYTSHPQEINRIRGKYVDILTVTEPIIADPAIFRKQVVNGITTNTTVAKLLLEMGIKTRAGANEIASGIAKVSAYINGGHTFPHVITGDRPGPLLYIAQELEFISDEVYSYYWRKNPQGQQIDEPIGNNDHALDTIKYMLSKRPDPSEIIVPEHKLPPGWMLWHEMEGTPSRL